MDDRALIQTLLCDGLAGICGPGCWCVLDAEEAMRGYFGIGVYHGKSEVNIGTLWRSAYQLGASFVFTVGRRYKQQSSDTPKTWRHIPLYNYASIDEIPIPHDCLLVGIEMGGKPLSEFKHPKRAVYLLGAEDHGLDNDAMKRCQQLVSLESVRTESYNVSVAGSLVMYSRMFGGLQ